MEEQKEPLIVNASTHELELALSDWVYEWMIDNVNPIISKDFCGWIFVADKKRKIWCVVDLGGYFSFFSPDKGFNIKAKTLKKLFMEWARDGKIVDVRNDPFVEWGLYNNLRLNYMRAAVYDGTLFVDEKELPENDPNRRIYNNVVKARSDALQQIVDRIANAMKEMAEEVELKEESRGGV